MTSLVATDMRPLKAWVTVNGQTLPESTSADYEFRYVDIGGVGTGVLTSQPRRLQFSQAPSRARRVVNPGDSVFSTVRTYLKAVWTHLGVERDLVASTGFAVLTPRANVDPVYLGYLLQSPNFIDNVAAQSIGIAYPAISESVLSATPVSMLVSLQDQSAAGNFLQRFDIQFTRLIRNKRRLIALLNEEKQAIIQQAVTRGLVPEAPLKPSGVEWLGDIPAHWELGPLRRFCSSWCDGPFGSGLTSAHYSEQGIRVIRLQNIGFAEFKNTDAAFIPEDHYASLGDHDVEAGDLLVAGLGDARNHPGRAAVAPLSLGPTMVKADCFRFRPLPEAVDPHFMALQLSATSSLAGHILSTGATRSRINLRAMADRRIAVPPLNEQELIAAMLSNKIEANRLLVDCQLREIELIREYRTRLISDVVTGQLDVRDVQFDADFVVEDLDAGGVELLDEDDVSLEDSDEIMDEEAGVA